VLDGRGVPVAAYFGAVLLAPHWHSLNHHL
jgi:hypothetical protein